MKTSNITRLDLRKFSKAARNAVNVSKTEKYYKIPKGDEFFDEKLSKYALKDTLYYIYRIPTKSVAEGTFKFKNLDIKPNEVVDFYADHSCNFRKMEVSVYMNDREYQELRSASKDFKDTTTENVRRNKF